jgi:hypothetical protein
VICPRNFPMALLPTSAMLPGRPHFARLCGKQLAVLRHRRAVVAELEVRYRIASSRVSCRSTPPSRRGPA